MADKEWSTNYPTTQDSTPPTTEQPTLVNGEDNTRVSQIHTLRDKLDAVCKKVGDDSGLPAGSILAGSGVFLTPTEIKVAGYTGSFGELVRCEGSITITLPVPGANDLGKVVGVKSASDPIIIEPPVGVTIQDYDPLVMYAASPVLAVIALTTGSYCVLFGYKEPMM